MESRTIWLGIGGLAIVGLIVASLFSGSAGGQDSDGDGLDDSEERAGWVINIDLVGKRILRQVSSDVNLQDTDGDGLDDAVELLNGLDPRDDDTDDDGLTDCQEQLHTVKAECEDPAFTAFDGGYGTDPSNADSDRGPSRYVREVLGYEDESFRLNIDQVNWGDGISDGDEILGRIITLGDGRSFEVTTDPLKVDTDGDRLEDGEELLIYGTHPGVADTDGDTCSDGLDPRPLHEERYDAGLATVTLQRSGNIYFHVVVGDVAVRMPEEGGMQMDAGTHDVSSLIPLTRPEGCPYSLHDPWSLIQVLVVDFDTGSSLDVSSTTKAHGTDIAGTLSVWLNAADDRLGLTRDGPYQDDPFQFEGPDGSIVLRPRMVL